jgi:hypothetical protein
MSKRNRTTTRPNRARPSVERLEDRTTPSSFRSVDGTGNNTNNPDWGSTGETLLRVGPTRYADGINAPAPQGGVGRPSARAISNSIVAQTTPDRVISDRLLSAMAYGWGQFIDHDMDLTTGASPSEPFNIVVPSDPTDPFSTAATPPGPGLIFFNRSEQVPGTGVVPVGLGNAFNRVGIVSDGTTFSGGLDGGGNALSAQQLGSSVTLNGSFYAFGAPNANDVVSAAGQAIGLPNINASRVSFIATGVNGNQANQTFTVTYTDGSTQSFTQSISDWFTPQNFPGESTAVTTAYRDTAGGGQDNRTFLVYAYSLAVNTAKQVQSVTLPNNGNVEVLAVDVTSTTPRQQPNDITAFLDASMVYGSDARTADALRTHSGGLLKSSPGPDGVIGTADDWLPFNNTTYFPNIHDAATPADPTASFKIANDAHLVPNSQLFMAGDIRANENIELTSLHTLFMREHNRIANALHAQFPSFGDETLYQFARRQVGAEIQAITYNEWIPAVLGPGALPAYTGYKANVNPDIATEFSTALFRVGHSMLGDDVEFIANDGTPVRPGISLANAFFNPPQLQQQGISPILKYLASDPSSEIDNSITDPVRNFLFGPPGAGGFDLASLNIQRGRDHGIANYNAVRVAYGLPAIPDGRWDLISSDPTIQAKLQQLYQNVNNIDLWVGALAEDHVPGTSTGPLIRAGLVDQFTRLRDGDSFFYKNPNMDLPFSASDQAFLENNRSLSDLIRLDSAADVIQDNPFFFRVSISGTVYNDLNANGVRNFGEGGLSGRTVQVFNVNDPANPVLVATTTTDSNGRYRVDVFDGLSTGNFQVVETVPSGWVATTANPRTVNIPRGETFLNVNFGNFYVSGPGGGGAAPAMGLPPTPTTTGPTAVPSGVPTFAAPSGPAATTDAGVTPPTKGAAPAAPPAVVTETAAVAPAPADTAAPAFAAPTVARPAATDDPLLLDPIVV